MKIPNWMPYVAEDIPSLWRFWLGVPGSLTKALEEKGGSPCILEIQQEGYTQPWLDECEFLSLEAGSINWVREITLSQETRLIYARSVFPSSLIASSPVFSELGTNVLASLLFSDPDIRRGDIEVAKLSQGHALFDRIASSSPFLWARRSRFHVRDQQLLVCEVFLDAVAAL
jgi:chorismate--pyruvate lyase